MEIKINKEWVEIPCDNCKENMVSIETHAPYFGRFCGKCMTRDNSIKLRYE